VLSFENDCPVVTSDAIIPFNPARRPKSPDSSIANSSMDSNFSQQLQASIECGQVVHDFGEDLLAEVAHSEGCARLDVEMGGENAHRKRSHREADAAPAGPVGYCTRSDSHPRITPFM